MDQWFDDYVGTQSVVTATLTVIWALVSFSVLGWMLPRCRKDALPTCANCNFVVPYLPSDTCLKCGHSTTKPAPQFFTLKRCGPWLAGWTLFATLSLRVILAANPPSSYVPPREIVTPNHYSLAPINGSNYTMTLDTGKLKQTGSVKLRFVPKNEHGYVSTEIDVSKPTEYSPAPSATFLNDERLNGLMTPQQENEFSELLRKLGSGESIESASRNLQHFSFSPWSLWAYGEIEVGAPPALIRAQQAVVVVTWLLGLRAIFRAKSKPPIAGLAGVRMTDAVTCDK